MQLLRTVLFLASIAVASLVATDAAADAHRNKIHKKLERLRRQTLSSQRSLRRADKGHSVRSAARADADEWAVREGMLHLQAAEVETEAMQDIAKVERMDKEEEHPEMAEAQEQERRQVEGRAAADWSAVSRAASAEALYLKQRASTGGFAAAAPSGSPAAAADFSWAHKMDGAKPLQEQGFEGKAIQHVDFDTMTDDWHKEHVQSWSTIKEICMACSRHPDNSWCKGKCPGALAKLGRLADTAVADAAGATSDAAADAAAATKEGGTSLKDKMLPGGLPDAPEGLPEARSPKLPESDGTWGPGGIFKSTAADRMLGLPVLMAALLQILQ